MNRLYIEKRELQGVSLAWDLSRHLYARSLVGTVAIVTPRPVVALSTVRKQWYKLLRQARRARASTLNAARILELNQSIASMERMRFAIGASFTAPERNILLSTLDTLLDHPPNCQTLYVTCPVRSSELEMLISHIPDHGLVVLYHEVVED